jgi:hypothetical protein
MHGHGLLGSLDGTSKSISKIKPALPSIWGSNSEINGEGLEDFGFVRKGGIHSSWSPADVVQLEAAVRSYASGTAVLPGLATPVLYWLSHHIFDRRFSQASVLAQLRRRLRLEPSSRHMVEVQSNAPPLLGDSAKEQVDALASDSDSDDEVVLNRPVPRYLDFPGGANL